MEFVRRLRFLGYAGTPWFLTAPCFVMSIAATVKIIYLHIQHRRLAAMIYRAHMLEPAMSPDISVANSAAERCGQLEAEGSTSGPTLQQYTPNPQTKSATDARPGTAQTSVSMTSSVLHRRALPIPTGLTTIANVITPAIFRDTDEETNDDEVHSTESPPKDRSGDMEWASWLAAIRGPTYGSDSNHTGTTEPQINGLERWISQSSSNSGPPKLPNVFKGIWRLFLFQAYVHILCF